MSRIIKANEGDIYDIELSKDLLKANEELAQENKRLLKKCGIKTIDVMGSIGTGKTALIGEIVSRLKGRYRIAAIAGDLTTTIDADSIAKHGVEVIQINTGKECHLDANLVKKALKKMNLNKVDLLFIENVGNLICPTEFPLGSDKRVVVISVTEGPNIVVKHPHVFMEANVVVINKIDIAKALEADIDELEKEVKEINPRTEVVRTSCKNGAGIPELIKALEL
ncbi:hydrogenase nickel incorporation protein HypB [Candidatus Bathyarchaeota archaeon]|nr:hydrogenase nickel incorporation protein HypB [Candidatus Bathyarchaeota archaeon]